MTADRKPPLFVARRRRPPPPDADSILSGTTPVSVVKSLWPVAPVGAVNAAQFMPLAEAVRMMVGAGFSDAVARTELARRIFTDLLPVSAELVTYERPAGTGVLTKLRWPDAGAQLGEQMLRANGQRGLSIVWETGELRWTELREAIPYHALIQGAMVGRAEVLALVGPAATTPKDVPDAAPTSEEGELTQRSRGRPSGSDQYAGDPAIVARVIALCDSHDYVGPSRVRRATRSLVNEIDGGALADISKIRRIVEKVKKLRSDL